VPPHAYPVGSGPQSTPPEDEPKKGHLDLRPTQLAGGALAAVTSAVAASKFGVTGTVVGAAFGSVVSSVASAVYQTSLTRAGDRIRTIVVTPTGARGGTGTADPSDPTAVPGELTGAASPIVNDTVLAPNGLPWPPEPGQGTAPSTDLSTGPSAAPSTRQPTAPVPSRPAAARPSKRYLKPALALGGFAFVASVGAISLSETVLGHPISNSSDTGTSLGSVVREASGNEDESSEPASPAPSASPSTSDSPSDSPSDSATESPSDSTSASDSSESSSSDSDQKDQNPQGGDSSPSPDGGGQQAAPTADAGQ